MSSTVKAVRIIGILLLFAGTSFAARQDAGGLPPPSERYAVVVGVGTYKDQDIKPLYGADNDAKALAAALGKYAGFPKDHIALLTSDQQDDDRKSTRTNILRKLREMATNGSYSGLMLFAFSGHGIQKDGVSLLLPSDLPLSDLEDYAIPLDSVTKNLRTAKQVLMFIDACREEFAGAGENKLTRESVESFQSRASGIAVSATFFATGPYDEDQNDGLAYQLPEEKMGVFTWVVTQELEAAGRNNTQLTLGKLREHLENRVPAFVEKNYKGKKQKPYAIIAGYKTEELVLAGPPDKGSDMTPIAGPPGLTVLISKDGKSLNVTDEVTGRVSTYVRTDGQPDVASNLDVTAPATSDETSLPLWGSTLLIGPNSEIYVADANRGGVIVFDADINRGARHFIDFNSGRPWQMVVAPRRGEVYVIDEATRTVGVIDVRTHKLVRRFQAGNTPRAIAVTPDERKLYVANEQPAPQGTISVIDLDSGQAKKSISGVNCPESLAVSPDGRFLYVSSQCGAGEDPVFVIDTRTDTVVNAIPGLAVGSNVAITPTGEKLYVARAGFYTRDAATGRPLSIPDQISVIDTKTDRITASHPSSANLFAVTPDGKFLIARDGLRLNFIDTATDTVVKTIQFDTMPAGIAVGRNKDKTGLLCYVWLPEENRMFFTGLSGILPPSQSHK
jgi:DNA-binding beta-propeller fold protein YncE